MWDAEPFVLKLMKSRPPIDSLQKKKKKKLKEAGVIIE